MLSVPPAGPLDVNVQHLKKAALFFRAINHEFRLNLLRLLHQHQQLTVTEIFVKLRTDQPVTSFHLSILRDVKLVQSKRIGKQVYYSIDYIILKKLHVIADELVNILEEKR